MYPVGRPNRAALTFLALVAVSEVLELDRGEHICWHVVRLVARTHHGLLLRHDASSQLLLLLVLLDTEAFGQC